MLMLLHDLGIAQLLFMILINFVNELNLAYETLSHIQNIKELNRVLIRSFIL
ncbi:protein of unknown function [Xenorhabdus doucetiae]|uniref:Uncharacterized protein n=1 Tax=Xenorhabdus doucetiae TaxID=351671 RepID=A0A068QT54_9GAMM|nr:protein of unknown function [Xenorhabdus doucetiae]